MKIGHRERRRWEEWGREARANEGTRECMWYIALIHACIHYVAEQWGIAIYKQCLVAETHWHILIEVGELLEDLWVDLSCGIAGNCEGPSHGVELRNQSNSHSIVKMSLWNLDSVIAMKSANFLLLAKPVLSLFTWVQSFMKNRLMLHK